MLGEPRAGPPRTGETRRVGNTGTEPLKSSSARKQSRDGGFKLREQKGFKLREQKVTKREGGRGRVSVGRIPSVPPEGRRVSLQLGSDSVLESLLWLLGGGLEGNVAAASQCPGQNY